MREKIRQEEDQVRSFNICIIEAPENEEEEILKNQNFKF